MLDRFLGCIIGGAIGDALGYAVEFMDYKEIIREFGIDGITDYRLQNGKAIISDDTQMTLFTCAGILYGTWNKKRNNVFLGYPIYIYEAYNAWLQTQNEGVRKETITWLNNIKELNRRRAPGMTCLSALASGKMGTITNPINQSKGCGGLMRVAPIGLYFSKSKLDYFSIGMEASKAAAITHGHELGYIPAFTLAVIIAYICNDNNLLDSINYALELTKTTFANKIHINEFIDLLNKAVELVNLDIGDYEAIRTLGEGWVAEENLAISIYCALKYQDNFEKAIVVAVNHDGDSDSTGAVTGNILGAYLGYKNIPSKYVNNLELKDVIETMTKQLYEDKYVI